MGSNPTLVTFGPLAPEYRWDPFASLVSFRIIMTDYRLGHLVSTDRVVCPHNGHATFSWLLVCVSSRANLQFGASLPGITARELSSNPAPSTRPRSLPLVGVTRPLKVVHDDRVSSRRCTPLRIWLDIHFHLPRSVASLWDPSRFLGVRLDVSLLDSIHQ